MESNGAACGANIRDEDGQLMPCPGTPDTMFTFTGDVAPLPICHYHAEWANLTLAEVDQLVAGVA